MNKKQHRVYSESFRLEVLRDYYSSGNSKYFTIRKWGLSSISTLNYWIRHYGIELESLSLSSESLSLPAMSDDSVSREKLLEQEVLNLRKALEMEKLRSRAFEKLIETTEKEEGIQILKKDGAKQ